MIDSTERMPLNEENQEEDIGNREQIANNRYEEQLIEEMIRRQKNKGRSSDTIQ